MELITVQEAAARAKVSVKAIYYAIKAGNLAKYEQFGRLLLSAAEVATYRPRAGSGRETAPRKIAPNEIDGEATQEGSSSG